MLHFGFTHRPVVYKHATSVSFLAHTQTHTLTLATTQDGKPFTHYDLQGHWSVLYFGFTHCPDICPDELEKLAEAIDIVERDYKEQVLPVFITIDPHRDTPKKVRAPCADASAFGSVAGVWACGGRQQGASHLRHAHVTQRWEGVQVRAHVCVCEGEDPCSPPNQNACCTPCFLLASHVISLCHMTYRLRLSPHR